MWADNPTCNAIMLTVRISAVSMEKQALRYARIQFLSRTEVISLDRPRFKIEYPPEPGRTAVYRNVSDKYRYRPDPP